MHFHSIIGEVYGKGKDSGDGVVPYRSAHLDGVDSEIVVPASHFTCTNTPAPRWKSNASCCSTSRS